MKPIEPGTMTDNHRELLEAAQTLRIWDLPIRLFHWSIVLLIGAAWWSAEEELLDWHRRIGYAILTLVLFRVLWGFLGSTTARFTHFIRGPRRVFGYFRNDLLARKASANAGHNPIGGWSALAMLAAMLLQTLLGLFAVDIDGLESGPLSYLVSFDTGRFAAEAHHLLFNILLALIILHIVAILFYRLYKNENLLTAMISGSRSWSADKRHILHYPPLWHAVVLLMLSVILVAMVVMLLGQ